MYNLNTHMVSALRWDTVLDRKEEAHRLQQRLSVWSRNTMPRELNALFDQVCPKGKTWRIKSLEIDLGVCAFSSLESDLNKRLHALLKEKLIEMLTSPHHDPGNEMALLPEAMAGLDQLVFYLLNGILPWTGYQTGKTINTLFEHQLKTLPGETAHALKTIGSSSDQARRRMAWQLNQGNLHLITEVIEPANSQQIIAFSQSMETLQSKGSIVKNGTEHFRQHLWYWILNYLFVERGSAFNRRAFMKSSLRQMAAHYNIHFENLLAMIQVTMREVAPKGKTNTAFMVLLEYILTDHKVQDDPQPRLENVPARTKATGQKNRRKKKFNWDEKADLNDWLLHISRTDSGKPKNILAEIRKLKSQSTDPWRRLDMASFEAIARAAAPSAAPIFVDTIAVLNQLCRTLGIRHQEQALWLEVVAFICSRKNVGLKEFVPFYIAALGKRHGVEKLKVLGTAIKAKSMFRGGHAHAIAMYEVVVDQYQNELVKCARVSPEVAIHEILRQLYLGADAWHSRKAMSVWHKLLTDLIQKHPSKVIDALLKLPNSTSLTRVMQGFRRLGLKANVERLTMGFSHRARPSKQPDGYPDAVSDRSVYKGLRRPSFNEFSLLEAIFKGQYERCVDRVKGQNVKNLIRYFLELRPQLLREVLQKCSFSGEALALLQANVTFTDFVNWIMADATKPLKERLVALGKVYATKDPKAFPASEKMRFWNQAWEMLQEPASHVVLDHKSSNPELFSAIESIDDLRRSMAKVTTTKQLTALCAGLLKKQSLPAALKRFHISDVLRELAGNHATVFYKTIAGRCTDKSEIEWLAQDLDCRTICKGIAKHDAGRAHLLAVYESFHDAVGRLNIKGIRPSTLQRILRFRLMMAVINGYWESLEPERIWQELLWEVSAKMGIDKQGFLNDIKKQIQVLPQRFQYCFRQLLDRECATQVLTETNAVRERLVKAFFVHPVREQIAIRNAGLVLLSSYLPMLLERLGLVSERRFTHQQSQRVATQYLQYIVTGLTDTSEIDLPLNKVLCGLPLAEAVPAHLDISGSEQTLIEGLIQAAVSHWPKINNCSIAAFRGNWLVRDGLLSESDDHWELVVDKRPYDLLIGKSPFAFSIIRFPWMEKPLKVTWPY